MEWETKEKAPYEKFVLAWLFLPKNPTASGCVIASKVYVDKDDEGNSKWKRTVNCWWANDRYYHDMCDTGYITHWMSLPTGPEDS